MVCRFTNRDNIDFDLAQRLPPVQEFDLQEDFTASVDYATRYGRAPQAASRTPPC